MKKKVLTLALALLMVLSSVVLFACNEPKLELSEEIAFIKKEVEDESAYNKANILTSEINGYAIKNLVFKDESDDEAKFYNGIFSISINNILKCEGVLKGIKSSKLNGKFESFKKEKDDFRNALENYGNADSNTSTVISRGFYERFKEEAKGYIIATCDLAQELLKFCVTTYTLPKEDDETYEQKLKELWLLKYNYETAKAVNDVKNFLFDSAKGKELNHAFYKNAKDTLERIVEFSDKSEYYPTSEDDRNEFNNLSKALDNQRKIVYQAISNFSVYELEKEYDNNEELYYKNDETKKYDYAQLKSYFEKGGILITYFVKINEYNEEVS